MNIVTLSVFHHRGEKQIKIEFAYNSKLVSALKTAGAKWSKTVSSWYIAYSKSNYDFVVHLFTKEFDFELKIIGDQKTKEVLPEGNKLSNVSETIESSKSVIKDPKIQEDYIKPHFLAFKQFLEANRYSNNTVRSYCDGLKIFLSKMYPKPVEEITNKDLELFFHQHSFKNNLSISWQRLIINALKLFFAQIHKKRVDINLMLRPKKDKLLPNVLSKEEVQQILNALTNRKQKLMLVLIYTCGLRRSELLNLKPEHIDSDRKVLIIKQAKGRKDRLTHLPQKVIDQLRVYYADKKPKTWLFEGQKDGSQYSERSLNLVFKHALEKTTIKKQATLHWLRHSYATHLLEKGVNIRAIQELLGHSSVKTTEIYTHVTSTTIQSIPSPIEDLDI